MKSTTVGPITVLRDGKVLTFESDEAVVTFFDGLLGVTVTRPPVERPVERPVEQHAGVPVVRPGSVSVAPNGVKYNYPVKHLKGFIMLQMVSASDPKHPLTTKEIRRQLNYDTKKQPQGVGGLTRSLNDLARVHGMPDASRLLMRIYNRGGRTVWLPTEQGREFLKRFEAS